MTEKVLITLATGTTGYAITAQLLNEGYPVRIYVRSRNKRSPRRFKRVAWIPTRFSIPLKSKRPRAIPQIWPGSWSITDVISNEPARGLRRGEEKTYKTCIPADWSIVLESITLTGPTNWRRRYFSTNVISNERKVKSTGARRKLFEYGGGDLQAWRLHFFGVQARRLNRRGGIRHWGL